MYRKYVRKWRLLKRNRIICPEVAVNEQFLPGKSNFIIFTEKIENLPEKIEIFLKFAWKNQTFQKFAWKNRNLSQICLKKSKFFKNMPGKSIFLMKLPEKVEISLKFSRKNRNFFDPDLRPPRFQTRLTPLYAFIQ